MSGWSEIDTWIMIVGVLTAASCGLLGCFMVLRRMSMMGDAISHAVLPGLAGAFLLTVLVQGWVSDSSIALPGWLDSSDFEVYVDAFTRSGFGGGVNWYRNFQRNYDLTGPWHQARISIPSAFVGGLSDFVVNGGVVGQAGPGIALMESMCDDHRGTVLLEGIGHWNQQEAPEETNQALLAFLGGLA